MRSIIIIACIIVVAIIAFRFLLEPSIMEGEVFYKEHQEASERMVMMPMNHVIGKITYTQLIPMFVYDDEDWILKIRKYNDKKQEWETRALYVDKETFHSVNEGEWFSINDNVELEDVNIKRRVN